MVKKVKSCVFISGNGSNLRSIIKSSKEDNFPIKVELIISNVLIISSDVIISILLFFNSLHNKIHWSITSSGLKLGILVEYPVPIPYTWITKTDGIIPINQSGSIFSFSSIL